MSEPGDFDFLRGSIVSFQDPQPRDWQIDERLSEVYTKLDQEDVDAGMGIPYAAIKFSCHDTANPANKAIMRIYIQIPYTGTVARGPKVRQQQAIAHHTHEEEKALHDLAKHGIKAVPKLVSFKQSNQDLEGCVPGGYINHVVWDLVPGKQIHSAEFWSKDLEYRKMVREKFRMAWEQVRSCGWVPSFPHPGKVIFDEESQSVYISGFRICSPEVKNMPFEDEVYAAWNLVKRRSKLPNYRRIAGESEFIW